MTMQAGNLEMFNSFCSMSHELPMTLLRKADLILISFIAQQYAREFYVCTVNCRQEPPPVARVYRPLCLQRQQLQDTHTGTFSATDGTGRENPYGPRPDDAQ
ncbi:hypothetical protein J6590_075183 [Homalodisca vitripennis]|nr:hypothetical protein J6590_075183 [Homalodisca vitripennis]